MSSETHKHLAEFQVPSHYYSYFYKKLEKNGPMYAVLAVNDDNSQIFFAPYKGKKDEFVSYVFFREEDGLKYLELLKTSGYITSNAVVLWKCTATGLASSYSKITKKEKSFLNSRKYHVITSIYLHGELRDMEHFWTDKVENIN